MERPTEKAPQTASGSVGVIVEPRPLYQLQIRIPKLAPINSATGGGRGRASGARGAHWAIRKRERDDWRWIVWNAVNAAGGPPAEPLTRASFVATRFSSIQPDYGNLTESWKPILDALCRQPRGCGVLLDDGPRVVAYRDQFYNWARVAPGRGYLTLQIMEIR